MAVIEVVFVVVAAKFYSGLGAVGGLLGSIFFYLCLTSPDLILNTAYDQTAQAFVYQTYPMGFFSWVIFGLAVTNFVIIAKK